jgi:flagellar assembly factor FliW
MILNTKHFGEINIDEYKIIEFEFGIPAFEEIRRYILLRDEEEDEGLSLWWLQSVDDENVAFVVADISTIITDYNPLINEDTILELGEYSEETFLIYNILVIPEDIKKTTVNLKAPIIINVETNKGKQVVVNNDEYTVKHCLVDEIERVGG